MLFSVRNNAISFLKASCSFFKFFYFFLQKVFEFIAQPSCTLQHADFSGQSPSKGGKLFMRKLILSGLRFRGDRGLSEHDWVAFSQNPSVRISQNSHQAVPWHRRLTNGSSTFQCWYGGRSVGLRAKMLDNRWATKRISIYSLALLVHSITACRWIRDKSPTWGKTFYTKI